VRDGLIAWLKAWRDSNRADEVGAAQHARLDIARLQGQASALETLIACEAVQSSGQGMVESLKAMTVPDGMPSEDVRGLRLGIANAILFYEQQELWLQHQRALLTALLPYSGQVSAIPADVYEEVLTRLCEHLRWIQAYQRLAADALQKSIDMFAAVIQRWGLWEVVAGFG
jgi:hypothetical protein